ncbi:MAG: hypothetical protein WC511_01180 [Candidatus Pacearchaeota archaeon]|jgi:hypothetical protein
MTEKFTWEDEKTPKQNPSLERQVATEEDYDKFIDEKKKSLDEFEVGQYLEDFEQKEMLKKREITLKYFRMGNEVYYSFSTKLRSESVFTDYPNS